MEFRHPLFSTPIFVSKRWERVGEYVYDRYAELGSGYFGHVFKGRSSKDTNKEVAVKEIKAHMDLKREIDILKDLSRFNYVNVVQLLHSEELTDKTILVMELCRENLRDYLTRQGGLLPERTVRIFLRQLVKGLKVLKSHKIIHRDLKPENILLLYHVQNPPPELIVLKLGDFGASRYAPKGIENMTQIGTFYYMAPEVKNDQPYGSNVDIWSVGVMVYEMFCGCRPATYPIGIFPSTVPVLLHFILSWMLACDPNIRITLENLENLLSAQQPMN